MENNKTKESFDEQLKKGLIQQLTLSIKEFIYLKPLKNKSIEEVRLGYLELQVEQLVIFCKCPSPCTKESLMEKHKGFNISQDEYDTFQKSYDLIMAAIPINASINMLSAFDSKNAVLSHEVLNDKPPLSKADEELIHSIINQTCHIIRSYIKLVNLMDADIADVSNYIRKNTLAGSVLDGLFGHFIDESENTLIDIDQEQYEEFQNDLPEQINNIPINAAIEILAIISPEHEMIAKARDTRLNYETSQDKTTVH